MSRKQKKQNRKKQEREKKGYPVPDRNYKSSLFTMVFSDKKELLGLYNAVSGKQYKDPGALSVNTLENAIYMAIKNDLSFVIDSRLSLYEHQSTYSPYLPLRMLLYLADLYADLTKSENLYGRKKVMLPPPQFIIFYNGEADQPDRQILKLTEGLAKFFGAKLKGLFKSGVKGALAYLLLKGGVADFKKGMDADEYGGAPFLGAAKPVIKAHGSSNARAIHQAIRQAKLCVENDLCGVMARNLISEEKEA